MLGKEFGEIHATDFIRKGFCNLGLNIVEQVVLGAVFAQENTLILNTADLLQNINNLIVGLRGCLAICVRMKLLEAVAVNHAIDPEAVLEVIPQDSGKAFQRSIINISGRIVLAKSKVLL